MLHVHRYYKVNELREKKVTLQAFPQLVLSSIGRLLYSYLSELYKITATLCKRYLKKRLRVREQNIEGNQYFRLKGDITNRK